MAIQPDDEFEIEVETDETPVSEPRSKPDIEIEDDTPEQDRGREPMPKEIVDELEADELEEYSEKVKLRLKQMKKVWHDERREKERAFREQQETLSAAQRLFEENKRAISSRQSTSLKRRSGCTVMPMKRVMQIVLWSHSAS